MKKLIIIDSNALVHRSYHALPDSFRSSSGELVNAVYGFTAVLIKVLREFDPEYIAATFDVAAPTFRDKEYREYKAKRVKAPDDLYAQIPLVKEVLRAFHIPIYEQEGFEADDVIGTIVRQAPKKAPLQDLEIIIVTGDLDALQLVSKHVKVFTLRKGIQDTVLYGEKEVRDRYGLDPSQLIDYRALRGDPSDNIIGVPGIGEKTATELLQRFTTLENLYDSIEKEDSPAGRQALEGIRPRILDLLRTHKDDSFFSQMLATIRLDVPVQFSLSDARWKKYNKQEVVDVLQKFAFKSLIGRLDALAGPSGEAEEPQPEALQPSAGAEAEEEEAVLGIQEELKQLKEQGVFSDKIFNLEKSVTPVLIKMQKRGVRLDTKKLLVLEKEASKNLRALEKKIYKDAGHEFNINSPQQLSVVLFDELELPTRGISKTPAGVLSTAASELTKLFDAHAITAHILAYREIQKLLSTYIIPLPKLLDADSRVHTTFNQLGTSTGRLSSSDPNLQNIPIRSPLGARIREAFIPSPGKKFISADYSQMELRIAAFLADDKEMLGAFERGEDIHIYTAARVFGIPEKEVTAEMRFRAKSLNFGLIYGIGIRSFARSAGIPQSEAKEFMTTYMEIFSGIASYMEKTREFVRANGYVETLWGRKRYFPDITSGNPMARRAALRAAINMPVQGTGADIVKYAMVEVEKKVPELSLLLQVHDELLWEASLATIKKHAPAVRTMLEKAGNTPISLVVDIKVGDSWGTLEPFK